MYCDRGTELGDSYCKVKLYFMSQMNSDTAVARTTSAHYEFIVQTVSRPAHIHRKISDYVGCTCMYTYVDV